MIKTRYIVTTTGPTTIVHRIGRAVGPIVRGTPFGPYDNGTRRARPKKKVSKARG